jgi:hypothetical protein
MTTTSTETWLDIPGWTGYYQVSNLGRVRSVERTIIRADGKKKTFQSKVLANTMNQKRGYQQVSLSKENTRTTTYVHRLVAVAFLGNFSETSEVCHNDGDKTNNNIANLRWDTRSGNAADKLRHGTSNRGERHGNAKLLEAAAIEIKTSPLSYSVLAKRFGVSTSTVYRIKQGLNWFWLNLRLQEQNGQGEKTVVYIPTDGLVPLPISEASRAR